MFDKPMRHPKAPRSQKVSFWTTSRVVWGSAKLAPQLCPDQSFPSHLSMASNLSGGDPWFPIFFAIHWAARWKSSSKRTWDSQACPYCLQTSPPARWSSERPRRAQWPAGWEWSTPGTGPVAFTHSHHQGTIFYGWDSNPQMVGFLEGLKKIAQIYRDLLRSICDLHLCTFSDLRLGGFSPLVM
jgi:hypothetical protein